MQQMNLRLDRDSWVVVLGEPVGPCCLQPDLWSQNRTRFCLWCTGGSGVSCREEPEQSAVFIIVHNRLKKAANVAFHTQDKTAERLQWTQHSKSLQLPGFYILFTRRNQLSCSGGRSDSLIDSAESLEQSIFVLILILHVNSATSSGQSLEEPNTNIWTPHAKHQSEKL